MKLTKLNELLEGGQVVKGRWELSPHHEIQYRSFEDDEEVKVKGSLVAAEPDALVFSVTEKQSNQRRTTSIVKLAGTWKLNTKNQITFEVEKESGRRDALTFKSSWKVNDSNKIIYSYEKVTLKTKKKKNQELVFAGYWDISEKNRLTYFLSGDSESAFRFRGAFQTKSILAKEGEIRYQLGAEVSARRKIQSIILFGKWKLSRDLGLSFEMEYENGKKKAILFGGEYNLDHSTQIIVHLKSEEGKPLGLELVLAKDFFGKDGQAFIRLQKSVEEARVEGGVKVRW